VRDTAEAHGYEELDIPVCCEQSGSAPENEMSRLSVSNCRSSRNRPAPTAARIAISLCLATERASSRFPTLAYAMSRTKATAPNKTSLLSDVKFEARESGQIKHERAGVWKLRH
jgi:hypothetical protein